jgi:hypothetical protein
MSFVLAKVFLIWVYNEAINYMLYHFLLIFPLDLKEFLATYLSSISPHFYPNMTFWRINTIHWSQDGFDQRESVTTIDRLISSENGNCSRTGSRSHSPRAVEPSTPWAVACEHSAIASVRVYKHTLQDQWKTLFIRSFTFSFTFQRKHFSRRSRKFLNPCLIHTPRGVEPRT